MLKTFFSITFERSKLDRLFAISLFILVLYFGVEPTYKKYTCFQNKSKFITEDQVTKHMNVIIK
jgi:hypothetical protein